MHERELRAIITARIERFEKERREAFDRQSMYVGAQYTGRIMECRHLLNLLEA